MYSFDGGHELIRNTREAIALSVKRGQTEACQPHIHTPVNIPCQYQRGLGVKIMQYRQTARQPARQTHTPHARARAQNNTALSYGQHRHFLLLAQGLTQRQSCGMHWVDPRMTT